MLERADEALEPEVWIGLLPRIAGRPNSARSTGAALHRPLPITGCVRCPAPTVGLCRNRRQVRKQLNLLLCTAWHRVTASGLAEVRHAKHDVAAASHAIIGKRRIERQHFGGASHRSAVDMAATANHGAPFASNHNAISIT